MRRGMAAAIAAEEARSFAAMGQAGANLRGRSSKFNGHFAGLSLIRKDAQKEPDRRSRAVDQQGLDGDRPIRHDDGDAALYDLMQDGMGVLLDASADGKASRLAATATRRIRCVAVDAGPSMLIRPDACVAWAGDEDDMAGLETALRRWFKPAPEDGSMVRSGP